jgi:transcriptional regulator NrdR family protein
MIIEAILKINPNAEVTVRGDDINTCEIEWHDGTTPISKEDIEAMIPTVEQEIADAEAKKIADKESANAKLKALGLTDDEIKAFRS